MTKAVMSVFFIIFTIIFSVVHPVKVIAIPEKSTHVGRYIVVMKQHGIQTDHLANELTRISQARISHKYSNSLHGFSLEIPVSAVENIRKNPNVKYIVEDRQVTAGRLPSRFKPLPRPTKPPKVTPTPTPQPTPVADPEYPNGIKRIGITKPASAAGVAVAVIDTGIDLDHPEFAGRIVANVSCVDAVQTGDDDNGHGTHIAGTIAASKNGVGVAGVAPDAKIIAIKVLDQNGVGSWSSVICGIEAVNVMAKIYNIKVANISLGGYGTSDNNCGITNNDPLHTALCNSSQKGITYVAPAMNSTDDASRYIPAAYDDTVITVSALADSDGRPYGIGLTTPFGPDDTFADFTNFGPVIDIAAPGVNIYSTYKNGIYATMSGTSMAAPHVAGAAVLYAAQHPESTWIQIRNALIQNAEPMDAGHSDPSGLHPEPLIRISSG